MRQLMMITCLTVSIRLLAAQPPAHLLATCQQRYSKGERHPAFVLEYIRTMYAAGKMDYNVIDAYWKTLPDSVRQDSVHLRLLYDVAVYRGEQFLPLRSSAYQWLRDHYPRLHRYFEPEQVDIRRCSTTGL